MRAKILCLALVFIFFSSPLSSVEAKGILIRNGFMTGNSFREMSHEAQVGYAMGLYDGMMLAPILGAPESAMYKFDRMKGFTGIQFLGVLTKALEDHPEDWNEGMHTIAYRALGQAFGWLK